MKILFICAGHTLDDDRITRKQARSLSRLGHEITVSAWHRYDYQEPGVQLLDLTKLIGKTSVMAGGFVSWKNRLVGLKALWRLAISNQPDLIVAHEFETALLAYFLFKRFGLPYVFDVHEFYEETISSRAPRVIRPMIRAFIMQMLWMVARKARALTVVSPCAIHSFKKGAPLISTAILYNSPLTEYFPFSNEETSVSVIVHEGDLSLNRGAIEMIEALAIVRKSHPFRFLVLGKIQAEIQELFVRKISQLGLGDVVDMPGRLPWTEFGKLESSGQIGLICMQPLPNNLMGLSNKLFDYMSCGLAVIGPKKSATEDILSKYKAGLCVDTTNPDEIANAICLLIQNPDMRREMALNGRKAIEDELGWHCMEVVMDNIYGTIEAQLKNVSKC